jgi:hypothetical protein
MEKIMVSTLSDDREPVAPLSGYDYQNQAWAENGRYIRCGHTSACSCFGRLHDGEPLADNAEVH